MNTQITVAKKAEDFKMVLGNQYMRAMENSFGDKKEAVKFLSSVATAVQKVPKLLDCSQESLINAIMCCVACKIYPNTPSGEAYLIPYGKEVQFQLGYKGVVTLLYRAGVDSIYADIVRKNDHFEYELGLNPRLEHKPIMAGPRGEAIACYVVAVLNGEKVYKVMSKDEIMNFKNFSQAAKFAGSPWDESKDPELNMWKKTVLKQLSKFLPSNEEVAAAIETDTQQDFEPQKPAMENVKVTTSLDE